MGGGAFNIDGVQVVFKAGTLAKLETVRKTYALPPPPWGGPLPVALRAGASRRAI